MERKNIVVLGSGFAGLAVARGLQGRLPDSHHLVVVSRDNFITFNPLLAEVVGASIAPVHAVAPVRQVLRRNVQFCMATVTEIDLEQKQLLYLGEGSGRLPFDQLVLACGVDANTDLVPGMADYALPLKTLGDALFLRNRLMVRLEQAEMQPDPEARRWLTTFVVIGGGFSGVEVAGEIRDFMHAALKYYNNVDNDDVRVLLLHSGDRLLPELPATLGRFAEARMRRDGIDIRLGTRVARLRDRHVVIQSSEEVPPLIAAGTVVNTIGTRPNELLDRLPCERERGRIKTASDMSVPGFDGLWAIGDCASVPNGDAGASPPTAQFADRQGRWLARNMLSALAGRSTEPFAFKPIGALSTIGHNRAVAEILGLRLSGLVGFLMWRGVYLLKLPTLARKARVFLEWNWDLMFPQDIAYLRFARTRRRRAREP